MELIKAREVHPSFGMEFQIHSEGREIQTYLMSQKSVASLENTIGIAKK